MLLLILTSIIAHVKGLTFTEPVNTTQGLIRGLIAEEGDYSMYLGVPYAKVNESNPFGASSPHPQMIGIFDADDDTGVCPQQEEFNKTIAGTLDCLHLNIYVPNTSLDTKLPVLVYVYGGKFAYGFSRKYIYGPKFLVYHDIILVIVNYRIGPYGFMCLNTEDIPGNQGLKDQYLALQWTYSNIRAFGGDAERITLAGNSAGAMSVDFHLLTDLPKYFNQAILQSGSGLMPEILLPSDSTIPFRMAEYLGFTTDDVQQAVSFLAKLNTDSVIAAVLELAINFRPCVEKKFDNVDRFIETHPEHKNLSHVKNIKIIAGFNSHEQSILNVVTDTLFEDNIMQLFNVVNMDDMISNVRRFYIGDGNVNQIELFPSLDAFVSDFKFNHPIQRSVVRYIQSGLEVFQYMFSYSGRRNFIQMRTDITAEGAVHADEIGYLFDISLLPAVPTFDDQRMIDRMTIMWTNFVKFGNPTPTTSDLVPVTWVPATRDGVSYLDINSELVLTRTRPYHARSSFWDLFFAANQHKLLANLKHGGASCAAPSAASFVLVSVCAVTTYLHQFKIGFYLTQTSFT